MGNIKAAEWGIKKQQNEELYAGNAHDAYILVSQALEETK